MRHRGRGGRGLELQKSGLKVTHLVGRPLLNDGLDAGGQAVKLFHFFQQLPDFVDVVLLSGRKNKRASASITL